MNAGLRGVQNLNPGVLSMLSGAMAGQVVEISKAFTQPNSQTTGFVWYNLESPPRELYPVITPIRNRVPRNSDGTGTAVNWKAVTSINNAGLQGGTGDGNRGGVIGTTLTEYTAAYRTLGFEDYVTFQANWSAKRLMELRPLAQRGLLRSLMIFEEQVDIGGNTSQLLGTTPTPTTALVSGGAMTAQATNVICIALTLQGYLSASVSAAGVPVGPISRTNADGSTDTYGSGAARKSAAGSSTTTGGTLSISATVTAVRGAVAYAWYVGASGAERLNKITTINSALFTADSGGTAQLASAHPASDQSTNALVYDGLFTQISGGGALTSYSVVGSTCTIYQGTTGGVTGVMATGTAGTGTVLTADGKGGIVEIDAMLKAFWDISKLSPQTMYISSQESQNIEQKILAGSSNPAFRFNIVADQSGLIGGFAASAYLNKFAMGGARTIDIVIHPWIPAGTILFYTEQVNYQSGGITAVLEKECRNDYFSLEWPLKSLKYEYGVYMDGLLKNRFPPAFGVLTNIANG